jgi:diguanylate cyclase (GGDEF)-like protein/PAS domain S-box-containing protein
MNKLFKMLSHVEIQDFIPLFKNIFDAINDLFFVMDNSNGTIRYFFANKNALNHIGCSEEVFGKSMDEVLSGDRLSFLLSKYNEAILTKKTIVFEANYKIDGIEKVGETSLTPIFPNGSDCKYIIAVVRDVTERKLQEQKLKDAFQKLEESEQQFKSLYEQNTDGIFMLDLKGCFVKANDKTVKVFGFSEHELLKMPFSSLVDQKDKNVVMHAFQQTLQGESEIFEITAFRKDGQKMIVSMKNTPMVVKDEIVGVFGIVRDVTMEKENELELQKAKDELELIWNNTNDAIFTIGHDGSILQANPAFTDTLGWSLEEIKGMTNLPTFINYSEEAHEAQLEEFRRGNGVFKLEGKRKRKDGKIINILGSYRVINHGDVLAVGMYKDISEQKRIEKKLQASESRYRKLVELSPEAIAVTSEDKVLYVNPAAVKLLGAKDENEILGKSIWKFILNDDKQVAEDRLINFLNSFDKGQEKLERIEQKITLLDGKLIYAEGIATTIQYNDKPAIQFIFRDVTERKNYEEKLEYLAFHDPLTGLTNRTMFMEIIGEAIKETKGKQTTFAIMYLDIDKFKNINDSLGHDVGDELLKQFAKRLESSVSESDTLCRIGGDEFLVLLKDIEDKQYVRNIAERMVDEFQAPYKIQGHEIEVTSSIGISIYPEDGISSKTLIRNADQALYEAKKERNKYRFS